LGKRLVKHMKASRIGSGSEATPCDLRDAPSNARGRSFTEKGRPSLSDREVQPLDERRVQFRGVLGVTQRLLESPRVADQHSSLDLDDAIVPTGLDHLAVQTSWPQNARDNSLVEFESVSDDQDSFGWLCLERERACFGSFVSLITEPRIVDWILRHLASEACKARDPFEPRAPPAAATSSPT
jgi:hypothetical protein